MPPDSSSAAVPVTGPAPESLTSPPPGLIALFTAFAKMSLAGGTGAFAGLIGPPVVIVTVLGVLYAHFGQVDALRRILAGVSCAAVGLLISVVFRMMLPLVKRRDLIALVVMLAVFVAIGLLRLPLPAVLLVVIPASIAITMVARKRAAS